MSYNPQHARQEHKNHAGEEHGGSGVQLAAHAIRREVPVLELTSVQGCETAFRGISLPMPMHVDGRRVTIDTAGHTPRFWIEKVRK